MEVIQWVLIILLILWNLDIVAVQRKNNAAFVREIKRLKGRR
jgi:hypothetical protein